MANSSVPGLRPKHDVDRLVSPLMAVEQRPLTLLAQRQTQLQTRVSAYGQVKSALATLQQSLSPLLAADAVNPALAVARDATRIQSALQGFVKAFNDLSGSLRNLTAYNAATRTGAALAGDTTIARLQADLRALVAGPATSLAGSMASLPDIGVGFRCDGTLALDVGKLASAVADPSNAALEGMLASMNRASAFLTHQLDNLPG